MGDTLVSVQRCEPFLDVLFVQIAEQAVRTLCHMYGTPGGAYIAAPLIRDRV